MGIMTRVVKIFKADIHGVMDQLEDPSLLLKQHLRDMEEALNEKEMKLKKLLASRDQAQQDYDRFTRQGDKLEQDLKVAIEKQKDDIARMLIKKRIPLNHLCEELIRHMDTLDQKITQFRKRLDEQHLLYDQLKHRSVAYFHREEMLQWGKTISNVIPDNFHVELSEKEIEFELLRRKEALNKEGART
jgi:phage shock protein A